MQPCDVWVNDYNPVLTMAWKSNIDLQYVWSGSMEVCNYVTGYTTKSEKSKDERDMNVALQEATNSKEVGFRLSDVSSLFSENNFS